MQADDPQLVENARTGNRDAFSEIVRRYQNLLCSIAYGITGRLQASEELAQDAFVTAWESLRELRDPRKLKPWLSGIVRNLARNRRRQLARDPLLRANARSERERHYIRRQTLNLLMLICVFLMLMTGAILFRQSLGLTNAGLVVCVVTAVSVYVVALLVMIVGSNRRIAQIREVDGTTLMPPEADCKLPKLVRNLNATRAWESNTRWLGVPIVSVSFSGGHGLGSPNPTMARGWFAFGDQAYGIVFATGGIAVAPIACGALSAGLISFGGFAAGAAAVGGFAIGGFAAGGVAAGWMAFGGIAAAWHAAMGGLAVARELAIGGLGAAEHLNDEVAKSFAANSILFQAAVRLNTFTWWALVLVMLAPCLVVLRCVPVREPVKEAPASED